MIYIFLAAAILSVMFAAYVIRRRKSLASTVAAKGSAFARVAEHESALAETKGKVIALKAAADAHNATVGELEKAAADVHAERDKINERLKNVAAAL